MHSIKKVKSVAYIEIFVSRDNQIFWKNIAQVLEIIQQIGFASESFFGVPARRRKFFNFGLEVSKVLVQHE